jgi:hypothetical protein
MKQTAQIIKFPALPRAIRLAVAFEPAEKSSWPCYILIRCNGGAAPVLPGKRASFRPVVVAGP